jgi:uncharacterized membrane protein HdeD (DUF308 family)
LRHPKAVRGAPAGFGPLQATDKNRGWYVGLGLALILLGAYCVYASASATIVSVLLIGGLILASGVVQIFATFASRNAGHIVVLLLIGALDVIIGLMIVQHAQMGALFLTLFLAVLAGFIGSLPLYGYNFHSMAGSYLAVSLASC